MGCGASSQPSAMEPGPSAVNGTRRPPTSSGVDSSPQSDDQNGNNASAPASTVYGLRPPKEVKAPVAFEVPGKEGDEKDSIIQSHPPRRLRRLEDEIIPTPEEIARRQALADQRRMEILQERAKSARLLTSKGPRRAQLSPIEAE